MKLFLASASPRRRQLLEQAGYRFHVVKPDIEEQRQHDESPYDYVLRLSQQKAAAGLILAHDHDNAVVLGADTIVVLDDLLMEKPLDFQDANAMLTALSGRRHQVMTAVTVLDKEKQCSDVVITDVWFKPLSEEEISHYWQTGEPCDKAGSYGIQGSGGRFVSRIEGSYSAVVGLPLFETDQLLQPFI